MGVSMTKWEGPIFTGEKDFKGSLAVDTNPGGEKVTNGSFTGNADGWTLTAGWTYSANTVVKDGNGTTTLSQDVSAVANDIYRVEYVVSAWSVGTVTVAVGGVSGTARGADGTYVEYITATGTGSLTFTPTNTARFTLDTISVKRVGVIAADRVNIWPGDRIAAGVEQAGDSGLFVRSENGTMSFIGDPWAIGAQDFYGRLGQRLEVNQSAALGGIALNSWLATDDAMLLDFNKSRSATVGTYTIVADGDNLGFITWRGADGSAYRDAARIVAQVDGTPGASDMPGRLLEMTTLDGASAVTERRRVDNRGVQHFTMHDNTATPVAATAALKMFAHNKSVADDGIITLPVVTTCGFGVVMCDTDVSERTQFWIDSTGTVTLINNAGSVVANADTDTNLCIGTAATQEPLQVKNRLGATKVVNVIFWYD